MADVHVRAVEPDDTPASLAARSSKLLLGGGLAVSAIAHLTLGGVVLFASPRLFATMPENSMMVDIVTPQELAVAQQAVENVATPARLEPTAALPPVATPSRPQPPPNPQRVQPLQRQSDLRPLTAPTQTADNPEQALPDPTQVAALLNLSMQVANPDLVGPPTDAAANLSADEIAAFKQHLKTCWAAPTTSSGAKPSVVVRISLSPDGRLRAEPDVISVSSASSVDGVPLMNSVKRALARCQPYSVLPAAKYLEWKLLDLNFSPDGITDVDSPRNVGNGG